MWTPADLRALLGKARSRSIGARTGWMHRFLLAWIVMGVIGVPLIAWSRKQSLESSKERDLQSWCDERASLLADQVVVNKNIAKTFTELVLVFGSYNATNSLTPSIFRRFSDETSYAHPLLLSLTFAQYVSLAGRPSFETTTGLIIKDIMTDAARATQPFYLAVVYSNTAGDPFIGYDMLSLPENYDAFEGIYQVHADVMTVPYSLILDGHAGIAVLFPVFKHEPAANANKASVEASLLGTVTCAFDFEALIADLLQQLQNPGNDFLFEVYDVTDFSKPIPLYKAGSSPRANKGEAIGYTSLDAGDTTCLVPLDFGDPFRRYTALCRFGSSFSGWGWYSLSWGLMFTVLVVLVGYILWAASKQMEKLEENYARMEALKTEAEVANQTKTNFLTTVSHEIRTPMNGVLGMLVSLLETKLNTQQLEYATIAHSSAAALVSLINDVLDLAKIQSGHMILDNSQFHIRMLVEEAMDVFRAKVREIGLEVAALVDDDVPDILEGDSGRLRQVLVNLLGNAIKFTAAGHVLLRISVYKDSAKCPRSEEDDEAGGFLLPGLRFARKGNLRRRSSFGKSKASKDLEVPQGSSDYVSRVTIDIPANFQHSFGTDSQASSSATGDSTLLFYDSLSGVEAADSRNSWNYILNRSKSSPGSRDYSRSPRSGFEHSFAVHGSASPEVSPKGTTGHATSAKFSTAEVSPKGFKARRPCAIRTAESSRTSMSSNNPGVGNADQSGIDILSADAASDPASDQEGIVRLLVVCEDTGTGIAADAQIRIFQPFMQADSGTSRKYGGTGIGLSISRQIVHMMGGDLKYVTRLGVGTTFEFVVKFSVPKEGVPSDVNRNYGVDPGALAGIQGKTIVLVDGIPLRRIVMQTLLRKLGIVYRFIGEPNRVVEFIGDYYRRFLDMEIPADHLANLAQSLQVYVCRRASKQTTPDFFNVDVPRGSWEASDNFYTDSSPSPSSTRPRTRIVGRNQSSNADDELSPLVARKPISWNFASRTETGQPSSSEDKGPDSGSNRSSSPAGRCDVILVDVDAFGKNTGLELGRFLQSHKPGDARYLVREKSSENVKMGFASRLFKPVKVSTLVASLAQVTSPAQQERPSLSRTATLEKISVKKSLTALLTGRRFLVVDDNMVNRLVAKRMLERYAAAAVAVDGGQRAIDKLKESRDFDAVLMDIHMPEMDGFEATERIRALEARGELGESTRNRTRAEPNKLERLVIVALTADVFGANRFKCEDSGMDGYITKPLEERQLYDTMVSIFGPRTPDTETPPALTEKGNQPIQPALTEKEIQPIQPATLNHLIDIHVTDTDKPTQSTLNSTDYTNSGEAG